jgi:TPR repeat protein
VRPKKGIACRSAAGAGAGDPFSSPREFSAMPFVSFARPIRLQRLALALVFAVACLAGEARADEFSDAVEAFQAGDDTRAFQLFTPLAEQGNPLAQHNLGVMYEQGLGTAKNEATAYEWYKRAADQGNPQSAYNIGMMTLEGRGVPQDLAAGAQMVFHSAELGYPPAQHALGYIYLNGTGVDPNPTEAVVWFTVAAEGGMVDSQFNLGYLFENGTGVIADPATAYRWYSIAALSGDQQAQVEAQRVGATLSPEQRATEDQAAADWLAAHGR